MRPPALLLLALVFLLPPEAAKAERFRLELTGGSLANFAMTCFAENGDKTTRIERKEYLPQTYIIEAEALACRIVLLEQHDRLLARLFGEDGRLIAEIAQYALYGQVTLRSAGSWGPARAGRGGLPLHRPAH